MCVYHKEDDSFMFHYPDHLAQTNSYIHIDTHVVHFFLSLFPSTVRYIYMCSTCQADLAEDRRRRKDHSHQSVKKKKNKEEREGEKE